MKKKETDDYVNGFLAGQKNAIRNMISLSMIDSEEIVYLIQQEIHEMEEQAKELEKECPKE